MNRKKIAKELVIIARQLTAASDIDLKPYYAKMYYDVGKEIAKALKGIKGVLGVDIRSVTTGGDYGVSIDLSGFTRSDLEAEANVFVSFGIKKGPHIYIVNGKRVDWGKYATKLDEGEFTDVVPLRKIEGVVKRIFG